ncbi:MAG: hypothetical protein CSA33_00255 [Desulfobulbus propionicus]|nr:MAG: hypothetical protein CSA33_00255 [Desulfobulbus propionicus]
MKKLSIVPVLGAAFCFSLAAVAAEAVELDHDTSFTELKTTLLKRYEPLVKDFSSSEQGAMQTITLPEEESTLESWWRESVKTPLTGMQDYTALNMSNLYATTLDNSSQIKVFSALPLIRKTTIQEADGVFDTSLYLTGKYNSINEPVGDELKTGGPDRYEEKSGSLSLGLERKFLTGTKVALEHTFESYDSNSEYLDPEDQGISKTSATLTQPLLQGIGPDYNGAVEELAKIDYASSENELRRQIDSHLLEVTRSYWGLYMERSIYLQKQQLANKAAEIVAQMEERKDIDIEPSLLIRAKSQMFAHQLEADEAKFAILNAQSRIWALTNSPAFVNGSGLEYVTVEEPRHGLPQESMEAIFMTALRKRPEVEQSVRQLQSALWRHYRARNELLPQLDLFLQTYVKGLEGDYDHDGAYQDSWDEGNPSYSVGLRFGFPLMNNAAKAREMRKKLEIRQLQSQLDTTVANILLEAQISYREMVKYNMAMKRRYTVVETTKKEVENLTSRIDYLILQKQEYGGILYRLLDALERLNQAEKEFSASELTYNLALAQLQSAKGTLVEDSGVVIEETEENGYPVIKIHLRDGQAPVDKQTASLTGKLQAGAQAQGAGIKMQVSEKDAALYSALAVDVQ